LNFEPNLLPEMKRIADALEKLADPPEVISGELLTAESTHVTDATGQRCANALERIAAALEVANAAHLSGAQLEPGSPAALMVGQQSANMIASAMKKHQPPEGSSKLVKPS
jgi:hypothetical protein